MASFEIIFRVHIEIDWKWAWEPEANFIANITNGPALGSIVDPFFIIKFRSTLVGKWLKGAQNVAFTKGALFVDMVYETSSSVELEHAAWT